MGNGYLEDEDLLKQIKSGDKRILKKVYEDYRQEYCMFLLRYYGADKQDVLDSYPETFTKFYFNISNQKLVPPLRSSLKTYLFSIGKHIFHKRYFSKYNKVTELKEVMEDQAVNAEVLDMYENDGDKEIVRKLLANIGEKCRQILSLIYIQGYDTEAVVHATNLTNAGAVRKRKFDCLKKMRLLHTEMNF